MLEPMHHFINLIIYFLVILPFYQGLYCYGVYSWKSIILTATGYKRYM